MIVRSRDPRRRRGATVLEFAFALPVLLLLTLGMLVLGQGVSQFQVVAMLAREGARWASVHGTEYQATTGQAAATPADIYTSAILPKAVGFAPGSLNYLVSWSPNNQPGGTVTVTVRYQWAPAAYLGTMTMSSTSVMTVSY